MSNLIEKLSTVGYRLSPELAWQVEAALNTRPSGGCFLTGPAGSGKTFLAESVGKVHGWHSFFFQAFPGCRKEELFQTILPDASQTSGFRTLQGILPIAAEASQKGKTALVLDEWDKTHPSTDAFLLDFLQNGRVTLPGSEIQAVQENLVVFVTLNDERELSEPLLRRLPLVELLPVPPQLMELALRDTHGEHAHIPAAITLYRRSQLVNLTKPVTIQEVRQLLDAIDLLGERADWNRLVFQFITKNWDDHELLKSAETLPLPTASQPPGMERPELDVKHFAPAEYEGQPEAARAKLPRIQRDWMDRMPEREITVRPEDVYGVVKRGESGYDGVARALLSRPGQSAPGEDPSDLRIAQVGETEIIVFEALDFERLEEWSLVLQEGAELLLEARHGGELSQSMLLEFNHDVSARVPSEQERARVYSLTQTEMLMRFRDSKLRWTPEVLEVVTNNYQDTRELWDFLYGPKGVVIASRLAMAQLETEGNSQPADAEMPSNEQLRADYLFVLRHYKHLREWFALVISRNLQIWGRITCEFRNLTVVGSALSLEEFRPENESPDSKEEAEAIKRFQAFTQPAMDYYESHLVHVESELVQFIAQSGEFPPAVGDGGIFGLHEVHTDLEKIRREGLKLYMRKSVREA